VGQQQVLLRRDRRPRRHRAGPHRPRPRASLAQRPGWTAGTSQRQGLQYTALRFTQRLHDAGIAPSTGSVGDSFDNALAENLWSTIKTELLYWAGTHFATRAEAEAALLRYIDGWYNPRRIQDRLGGLSPDEYEEAWHRQHDPSTIHPEPDQSR
jgi:putative transposase